MINHNLVQEKLNEEAKKILLLIKEDYYNNSNEISRSTNFKYDKSCNVVYEEELDYDDMEKEVITYKYKYDRKGNWIEQVASCNGETQIVKRNITYY